MKLTIVKIDKAKAGAKVYKLFDGRGLYLEVTRSTPTHPKGSKLWRLKYHYFGKEKRLPLGAYEVNGVKAETSLVAAREKMADARKLLIEKGIDPMTQRKEERILKKIALGNSFRAVAEQWHGRWKKNKNAVHAERIWQWVEEEILPVFGDKPISEIEAPLLVVMMKNIERRGASVIAERCLGICSQVFNHAIAHQLAKRNPARDIKPSDVLQPRETKNHARIDEKDLPKLLQRIEGYQGQNILTRQALKLMALTFVRTHELVKARWCEVDFEKRLWVIPKERMKQIRNKSTGENTTTSHIIPLSTQTLEVLKTIQMVSGEGEYLFPGHWRRTPHMSESTMLSALHSMGYLGEMTGHGFRGLAATILYGKDFPEKHVDLQLSHLQRNKVRAAYDHGKFLPQRAVMLQWWADYLNRAREGKPLDNVLEFHRA